MPGMMLPQAARRSLTTERVNSASQSALSAVMLTSAISSIDGSLGVDEISDDVAGVVGGSRHRAPAGDDGAVAAHADPSSPGVRAVGMQGEVDRALRAHGWVGRPVPADERFVVPE